jgi:SAM-dependent methyltransferase
MVPALFAPWASQLLQRANPQPAERVLDLACGTGVVARLAAPLLGSKRSVTAIDLSPTMLSVGRAAAEGEGLDIEWRLGRAEQLPFADCTFDLVLCQFALMFFADRAAALTEAYRILTDDGRLFLNVWQALDRHPFYETLHHVIQRRLGMSAIEDIFALGDEDELCGLLTNAGFQCVEIEAASITARFPNPEGFLAGEIDLDTASIPSMQALDLAERNAIVAAISEDMKEPLLEVTQEDHVVIPFHAFFARAFGPKVHTSQVLRSRN